MIKLTEEIITQIVDEMESTDVTCIECGAKYFHAPMCQKGFGLSGEELVQRLQTRAAEIQKRKTLPSSQCFRCGETATGTAWLAYHGYAAILEAKPACEACSLDGNDGRPSGFLPNVVTKNTSVIHRVLKESFIGVTHT
jgi:hypothetical protein